MKRKAVRARGKVLGDAPRGNATNAQKLLTAGEIMEDIEHQGNT